MPYDTYKIYANLRAQIESLVSRCRSEHIFSRIFLKIDLNWCGVGFAHYNVLTRERDGGSSAAKKIDLVNTITLMLFNIRALNLNTIINKLFVAITAGNNRNRVKHCQEKRRTLTTFTVRIEHFRGAEIFSTIFLNIFQ